jgi:hypothetical protein
MKNHKNFFIIFFLLILLLKYSFCQHANDTICFTIYLSLDKKSLFGCTSQDNPKEILSGPVIMSDGKLLFYSINGYVLYDQSGNILDSFSLFKENKNISMDDPKRLRLAYPIDNNTILLYRKDYKENKLEIFQKKLYKRGYLPIDPVLLPVFKDIETAQLFNLTNNYITDDMTTRLFLKPGMVGFTSLNGGERWWSLDKFYSFTSPLIVEKNGVCLSFFPGLLRNQKTDVQKHLINPLGTYTLDNRRYYYGVHTMLGGQDLESYQKLYLCDQAGNLLYSNELLKQIIGDEILEYDKKSNTNFTVKKPQEFVFMPAVDKNGDIFYGQIDYHKKTIDVKKRLFYRYFPKIINPQYEDLIDIQRKYSYNPVVIECPEKGLTAELPEIYYRSEKNKRRKALPKEVIIKGYQVKICREMEPDLKRKFSQISSTLPQYVSHIKDSLLTISTAICPYSILLEHEKKGPITRFYYGIGDEVLSARVLNVTETFEIFIRVDLLDWAEILVFSVDGAFLNRFVFNRKPFLERKDIIAISNDRKIIEEDYERISEDYTYYSWELGVSPITYKK